MRRAIVFLSILSLCTGAILLAMWVAQQIDIGPPVLLYASRESDDIIAYDLRISQSMAVFPGSVIPDSNFFWSPNRRDLLRISLEDDFSFDLYRGWYTQPVRLGINFQGYSTPQWSPNGRTVIVPACQRSQSGGICRNWVFYRVDLARPEMRPLDWSELKVPPADQAPLPRSWQWLDNETLLIWRHDTLLTLNITDGTSETRATGLHTTSRNIQWTPDLSRVMYFTTDDAFCLHVLIVAERLPQTAICGDLDVNGNSGWLPDGRTVYYTMRDASGEHEIRLYDSVTRSDHHAANPPLYLDWGFDYVYPLPGTRYLIHHATQSGHRMQRIDTETGDTQVFALNYARPMTRDAFTPAPNGKVIAAINQNDNLHLIWPGRYSALFISSNVCCTLVWLSARGQ